MKGHVKAVLVGHKALEDGQKIYTFRATTEAIDRQGEIVTLDGWDFSAFERNPVILDSHNYYGIENIVGRGVPPLRLVDGAWEVDIVFNGTPRGRIAEQLVDEGNLRTVSVGFGSKERSGGRGTKEPISHLKKELLEVSVVPVPANHEAIRVRTAGTVQVGKALDFEGQMDLDEMRSELNHRRWRMHDALDRANSTALKDEVMSRDEKLAQIDTNLTQHHQAMLEWYADALTLQEMAVEAGVEIYLSAKPGARDQETVVDTKAGRTLSKKNEDAIKAAMGGMDECKAMLAGVLDAMGKSVEGEKQAGCEACGTTCCEGCCGSGCDGTCCTECTGKKAITTGGASQGAPSPIGEVAIKADLSALMAFVGNKEDK